MITHTHLALHTHTRTYMRTDVAFKGSDVGNASVSTLSCGETFHLPYFPCMLFFFFVSKLTIDADSIVSHAPQPYPPHHPLPMGSINNAVHNPVLGAHMLAATWPANHWPN